MPLYDYGCEACGFVREVRHGINETPQVSCPNDGCEWPMVKQIGAGSFRLKGQGYYETDFKPQNQQRNIHRRSDNDFSK